MSGDKKTQWDARHLHQPPSKYGRLAEPKMTQSPFLSHQWIDNESALKVLDNVCLDGMNPFDFDGTTKSFAMPCDVFGLDPDDWDAEQPKRRYYECMYAYTRNCKTYAFRAHRASSKATRLFLFNQSITFILNDIPRSGTLSASPLSRDDVAMARSDISTTIEGWNGARKAEIGGAFQKESFLDQPCGNQRRLNAACQLKSTGDRY